jgi:hypothetical protein
MPIGDRQSRSKRLLERSRRLLEARVGRTPRIVALLATDTRYACIVLNQIDAQPSPASDGSTFEIDVTRRLKSLYSSVYSH